MRSNLLRPVGKIVAGLGAICLVAFTAAAHCQEASSQRPNILVCMADDASWPYCGAYGCKWVKTPAFDQVARAGLLFQHAYTPNAKCAPSRACFLTGRNSWQLEEAANHFCVFPPKFKSFFEALAEHGYEIAHTGKGWAPGTSLTADGKPRSLVGKRFQTEKMTPPTSGISNNDYHGNFDRFLESTDPSQPWAFWYGALEPHRGYEFGSSLRAGFGMLSDIDRVPAFWPDTDTVRTDMLDYAYELQHFDTQLGRMLESLEKKGQLENTIVIVTADNGMPFPRVKGQTLNLSNHLPLAIQWPKGIQNPGREVQDLISFVDIAPTILEVAGVEWQSSGMQPITGKSLKPIFEDRLTEPFRDFVLVGKERHDVGRPNDLGYPTRGMIKGQWMIVWNYDPTRWPAGNPETGYPNTDGSPTKSEILTLRREGGNVNFWKRSFGKRAAWELYDLTSDPECMTNLAEELSLAYAEDSSDASGMQQTFDALRELMVEALVEEADPRMLGNGTVFDTYEYADQRTRDFYNRLSNGEEIRAGWINDSDREVEPIPAEQSDSEE